ARAIDGPPRSCTTFEMPLQRLSEGPFLSRILTWDIGIVGQTAGSLSVFPTNDRLFPRFLCLAKQAGHDQRRSTCISRIVRSHYLYRNDESQWHLVTPGPGRILLCGF